MSVALIEAEAVYYNRNLLAILVKFFNTFTTYCRYKDIEGYSRLYLTAIKTGSIEGKINLDLNCLL